MSSFTTLTLNTKVYNPSGYLNGISQWMERSASYPTGYSVLTNKTWQAQGGGAYHTQSKLTMPVVATDADSDNFTVGMLRSNSWCDIHCSLGNVTSSAERLDFYERIVDYVASDAFKLSVVNNEPVIGV